MKKLMILTVSSLLLFSSCGTYTGSGAYVGGSFGSILGSAIGGLAGGPRGSDIGTILGTVGGAVVGAAVGSAADQQEEQKREERHERIMQRQDNARYNTQSSDNYQTNQGSGFDSSNSGDDRLYDFSSSVESVSNSSSSSLEIVNARFIDTNHDNQLNRNETCKITFQIMNRGTQPVYDVVPTVVETTGNKHIYISPSIRVESIDPGKGVRYTAMVKADSRLKEGTAHFCVSVLNGNNVVSKVNEFKIGTTR